MYTSATLLPSCGIRVDRAGFQLKMVLLTFLVRPELIIEQSLFIFDGTWKTRTDIPKWLSFTRGAPKLLSWKKPTCRHTKDRLPPIHIKLKKLIKPNLLFNYFKNAI